MVKIYRTEAYLNQFKAIEFLNLGTKDKDEWHNNS